MLARKLGGFTVYVDTGFMRKGETEQVGDVAAHGIELTTVHAADRYFAALAGVTEPEAKRKPSVNSSSAC